MPSKIEIRQHHSGGLVLGHFYTELEPEEVQQALTVHGASALTDEAGIYIPEIDAAHEVPFHSRADVTVGDIIPIDNFAYQTILDRE